MNWLEDIGKKKLRDLTEGLNRIWNAGSPLDAVAVNVYSCLEYGYRYLTVDSDGRVFMWTGKPEFFKSGIWFGECCAERLAAFHVLNLHNCSEVCIHFDTYREKYKTDMLLISLHSKHRVCVSTGKKVCPELPILPEEELS